MKLTPEQHELREQAKADAREVQSSNRVHMLVMTGIADWGGVVVFPRDLLIRAFREG
jgi:hypothetical protein